MSHPSLQTPHAKSLAIALGLVLVAGFSAPFLLFPMATAAIAPPSGTVELSPTPVNATQSVPPNIAVTLDDSGSMTATRMSDTPPYGTSSDWSGGPWRCGNVIDPDHPKASDATMRALAMNGVFYNPTITYTPPLNANSTSFTNADSTLKAVWVDGIAVNRTLNPVTATGTVDYYDNPDLDKPSNSARTNLMGTATFPNIVTYYVSFGSCAANADSGSCKSNSAAKYSSGTNKNKYYYSYKNSTGSTGSGTDTVYYGTSLSTGTSTSSGWTQVVGTTTTTKYNTWTVTTVNTSGNPTSDNRWQCGTYGAGASGTGGLGGDWWTGASPMDSASHTLSDGTVVTYPNGGPYYYRLKTTVSIALDKYGNPTNTGCSTANCDGLHTLYNSANWEAVPVPASQYQNFANWYAYYRIRNMMARSALSRVFASTSLASTTSDGGYGSTIRATWQNLNDSNFKLPSSAIISSLIDTSACTSGGTTDPKSIQQSGATKTPPNCYRSAFFNWIFQTGASGSTPTRSALDRAGKFFTRGNGNTGGTGNLEDPYWQPPASGTGDGDELSCRQNFHMLVTDGLWNTDSGLPSVGSLTQPVAGTKLPDGVSFPDTGSKSVTSIYALEHDQSGNVSLSDLAFHYWATDLRPDLYEGGTTPPPDTTKIVSPYLPDQTTSVFNLSTLSGSSISTTNINQEIYFNPVNDPATWPHMSEYLIGLGVSGVLNYSTNTDCTDTTADLAADACDLRKGITNSDGIVGWPVPNGSGNGIAANIDDTWHAALAGRGQFFSAGNPQDLVTQLSNVLSSVAARAGTATTGSVNASVLSQGAVSFETLYSTIDWSGQLNAVTLNSNGTINDGSAWANGEAGAQLTTKYHSAAASGRTIFTGVKNGTSVTGTPFETSAKFDTVETTGLETPALSGTNDTLANRIGYLRGDNTHETDGTYRTRTTLLGAIINSQPVYVSFPASGYTNVWPAGSAEAATGAQSYDDFISANQNRAGTVYVGANDGMLHAFDAALVDNGDGTYGPGQDASGGSERWAFIPRAVYANLGNLTSNSFKYAPTVDATPVTRDVFFGEASATNTDNKWHTMLVGGAGMGGRGLYALDITAPTAADESAASAKLLWEVDSDAANTTGCVTNDGTACKSSDLGYTFGTPRIGRLATGQWVVIVSTGYFPDCSQTDKPSPCDSSQAPKDSSGNPYSALFVLDAQTGQMIAELKTPTTLALADGLGKVVSFGLATPVLGDYNNDQIDDVAFAGDLEGNLWRFDLSNTNSSKWSVALTYQGIDSSGVQGVQPITVMPRLFPDPTTNRFIVVFGTGKYLGAGDNTSTSAQTQAVYGVRDQIYSGGNIVAYQLSDLVAQTLTETTINDPSNPLNGATLRSLSDNPVPNATQKGGWYFNLSTSPDGGKTVTDAGERVVVTAGAIFNTNTAIISTLIPGSSDPCDPSTKGAVMFVDATTGSPGSGVSSLGGEPYVGGRVDNVRTSGSLPVVSALGGGALPIPGLTYSGTTDKTPVTGDTAIWRRRSWQPVEIQQ